MALDKFIEQTGLSPVTVWRFRKKKFLSTINICGRHYVLRSEIARFNSRALAGEFSKPCARPSITSAKQIADEEPTADRYKRAERDDTRTVFRRLQTPNFYAADR
jgi:hypothetical protein